MQLSSLIAKFLGKRPEVKNAMLVSRERSGTNYFLDVFGNTIPDSLSLREIFRPSGDSFLLLKKSIGLDKATYLELLEKNPLQIWLMLEAEAQKSGRTVMAKIFQNHARGQQDLWNHFRDENRIVHLIRRNPFDSLVSFCVARQTGRWLQGPSATAPHAPQPFELPRARVESYIENTGRDIDATRAFFKDADYCEVFYEDISTSVQNCAETICEIFDETALVQGATTKLQRQKRYTNAGILLNYDEIGDLDRAYF